MKDGGERVMALAYPLSYLSHSAPLRNLVDDPSKWEGKRRQRKMVPFAQANRVNAVSYSTESFLDFTFHNNFPLASITVTHAMARDSHIPRLLTLHK